MAPHQSNGMGGIIRGVPVGHDLEENTDRPGMDSRVIDLSIPEPSLCQQACIVDPDCMAFTYVKPSYQGSGAKCYLKSGIPDASPNECCVSGRK